MRLWIMAVFLLGFMGCGNEDNPLFDDKADTEIIQDVPDTTNLPDKPVIPENFSTSNLKKSGQTTSIANYDDGYYKTGTTANYTRLNEVVTDTVTGLSWQDNSDAMNITKPWLTQESYDAGLYESTQGDTAISYCENLNLASFSDWRLPSKRELESIVDYGKFDTSYPSTFVNVSSKDYWTSFSKVASDTSVVVGFFRGRTASKNKVDNENIRCVRGKSISLANFLTAPTTVKDSLNGLQWQDDYSDNTDLIKNSIWTEALGYCKNLSLDGKTDWRLPNINELKSLVDLTKSAPSINQNIFKTIGNTNYFSSTSYQRSLDSIAWIVSFNNGRTYIWDNNKNSEQNVRCVRSLALEEEESTSTLAEGSKLFAACAGCHGKNGEQSALGKSDIIAGKNSEYISSQLIAYRDSDLDKQGLGGLMKGQVAGLSNSDIAVLSNYISKLEGTTKTTIPDSNELEITEPGTNNPKASLLFDKCRGCHGQFAEKNALGKSEIIAGKEREYLVSQLKGYRDGTLNKEGLGTLMKGQVAGFTDADISAVADYISKL